MIVDMFCHWRYVLDNLFGAGADGDRAGRHPRSDPLRRAGRRVRRPRPRTRPTPSSSSRAASSSSSTRPGARGSTATSSSSSTWTAPMAARSRACTAAGSRPPPRPRRRSGIRTSRIRSRSGRPGARCRTAGPVRQRVQGAVGAVPPPRRRRRALPVGVRRGGEGNPARRARHPILGGAPDAGRAGDRTVSVATGPELILPDADGSLTSATRLGPRPALPASRPAAGPRTRACLAAAHVVADPVAPGDPVAEPAVDWDATMAYRRHLWSTASASRTRWTPPSAAARWAGRSRGS